MGKIRLKKLKDENESLKNNNVEDLEKDNCKKDDCCCEEKHHKCNCNEECDCGDDCNCNSENKCSEDCSCEDDCKCDKHNKECKCDKHNKNCECDEKEDDCKCGCNEKSKCCCEDDDFDGEAHEDQMQEAYNYLEMAQRVQAEFENYRRRTKETEKLSRQKGIIDAVEKFLPVIDSISSAKRQLTDENFIKAIDLIDSQIKQSLTNLGVKKIEAVGKVFDPNYHNAIMTGEDENFDSDIILEEYQEGFILGDKVIRHSVVKVNK